MCMKKIVILLLFGCMVWNVTFAQTDNDSIIEIKVEGVTFSMVRVKGGTFMMGSDALGMTTSPVHKVTLSDFYIGQTEVSEVLWMAVMRNTPEYKEVLSNKLPVQGVKWVECDKFVKRLSELTGRKFVLPTEAQWEYAARGGVWSHGYIYAGSDSIDLVADYFGNKNNDKHSGVLMPNELGIYDMSGKSWEWCSDWYGLYSATDETDPAGPSTGQYKVLRGGGSSDPALMCRPEFRYIDNAAKGEPFYGLRIVMLP